MASYATTTDVQSRMSRTMSASETTLCGTLLEDAALIIDSFNSDASTDAKKVVSCRMVIRAIGNGESEIPLGAMQGSMSGLGYSSSWTLGSNGSTGQLYLDKTEKKLLGGGSLIGSHSPTEDMRCEV